MHARIHHCWTVELRQTHIRIERRSPRWLPHISNLTARSSQVCFFEFVRAGTKVCVPAHGPAGGGPGTDFKVTGRSRRGKARVRGRERERESPKVVTKVPSAAVHRVWSCPVPLSKIETHLLASLGSKGKNRNSLACLRNAGFHSAQSYCKAATFMTSYTTSLLPASGLPGHD
jgi:hypothetical protein